MKKYLSILTVLTLTAGTALTTSSILTTPTNTNIINHKTNLNNSVTKYNFLGSWDIYLDSFTNDYSIRTFKLIRDKLRMENFLNKTDINNLDNQKIDNLTSKENGYFFINLFSSKSSQSYASIVIEASDLYVQGFIVNNVYNYFKNAQIKDLGLKTITNRDTKLSENYIDLIGDKELKITSESINDALFALLKYTGSQDIKKHLVIAITLTAESLRFFTIRDVMSNVLSRGWNYIEWQKYIRPSVKNWNKWSKDFYNGNKTLAISTISILKSENSN